MQKDPDANEASGSFGVVDWWHCGVLVLWPSTVHT